MKPTVFDDLIALDALYRPGPMAYIPVYARRKNGQEPVAYLDDGSRRSQGPRTASASIRKSMEIVKKVAGFSPAEADDLRKAIGKKIHSLMASLKDKFLEGCASNGVTPGSGQAALGRTSSRRRTTLQQGTRRLLRPYRLPHRWLRANHPQASTWPRSSPRS